MTRSDNGLKSIVADLKAMRYRTTDIARILNRTRQHINRILRELNMHELPLTSVDDLPHDMRERVQHYNETVPSEP